MIHIFLFSFIRTTAALDFSNDFTTTEKAPFSAEAGIFSNEETGQVFPMAPDTDFEEARAALRAVKNDASIIASAKPPGFEPQPPGIEESPEFRIKDFSRLSTAAQRDIHSTPPPTLERVLPPSDSAVESFGGKELPMEQEESSGENRPNNRLEKDAAEDKDTAEGSGQEELTGNVEKVSGEVGQHFDERRPTLLELEPQEHIQMENETTSDTFHSSPIRTRTTTSFPGVNYDPPNMEETTTLLSLTEEETPFLRTAANLLNSMYDAMQSSVPPDNDYSKPAQGAVLAIAEVNSPPETVATNAAEEAPPPSTVDYGAVFDMVGPTPPPESYFGGSMGSSYDMPSPQTNGYEDMPSQTMTENMSQKQLQDFSDSAARQSVDVGRTLKVSELKKVTTSRSLAKNKKLNRDAGIKAIAEKTMLIGPPAHRAPPRRGAVEGCPEPGLCAKNCFVYINERGCQDCQCLWQALSCDVDDDCPEAVQYCDLGRCNCRPGTRQDMGRSGFCEADPDYKGSQLLGAGQFLRRFKRVAAVGPPVEGDETVSTVLEDNHSARLSRELTSGILEEDDPTLSTVIISRSLTPSDSSQPPAPPPRASDVSRILIDRNIASTFPYLPPLQPLSRIINKSHKSATTDKSNDKTSAKRWKDRKSIGLVEFPISARFIAARSRGVSVLPPLPLGIHPSKEELQRHNQFKKSLIR
ncbi:unnamed protein product [Cylicocyclus nassatus]|uniref:Uncharacterized protein n=1 Tax=Cylicocyclus nassatus TaxID=53992 RepID=A0AA36MG75_CYLNA|nr:unnamed protein product [Cylicocyclus nassatus]